MQYELAVLHLRKPEAAAHLKSLWSLSSPLSTLAPAEPKAKNTSTPLLRSFVCVKSLTQCLLTSSGITEARTATKSAPATPATSECASVRVARELLEEAAVLAQQWGTPKQVQDINKALSACAGRRDPASAAFYTGALLD